MKKTVHFKKDEATCACGASCEFFHNGRLTSKVSEVSCPDCLEVVHVGFRVKPVWKDNVCHLWLYKGRKKIGGGKLMCGKSMMSFIYDVYVLPQYRGGGFGARIVRELVRRSGLPVSLKAIPYKINRRDHALSQEALFKFYEKLGFVRTGILSDMICIHPLALYTICTQSSDLNLSGFPVYESFVKGHEEIRSMEPTFEQSVIVLLKRNKEFFGLEFENVPGQEQEKKEGNEK